MLKRVKEFFKDEQLGECLCDSCINKVEIKDCGLYSDHCKLIGHIEYVEECTAYGEKLSVQNNRVSTKRNL